MFKRTAAVAVSLSVPVLLFLGASQALAQAPGSFEPSCGWSTYFRTPEEVLADHRAALAAGDYDAVYCNYSPDAVVISDGGIDRGHDEIRASVEFFGQLFGGTQPAVVQEIVVKGGAPWTHVVRLLFTIDTPCVTVPDGVDTYVIRFGQIHAQTSHAFPVFQCFP